VSHIARIEMEINDLGALRAAATRLGGELVMGQASYQWYGQWMGDTPMPEGVTSADLGKCHHAIRFSRAAYEVGVVQRGSKYQLLWDYWVDGGLEPILGKNAGLLKQAYGVERARAEARRRGLTVHEQRTNTGIRLTLRGGK